jgi:multiple sugar transport system permease protein
VLRTALLLVAAGMFLLPLAWMAVSSLKPADEVLNADGRLLPVITQEGERVSMLDPAWWTGVARTTTDNYRDAWTSPVADFPLYLRNSLIVALLSVLGMVASSAVVAYGFSRVRWRGRNTCFGLVLASMMIPFPVLMVPLYVIFKQLGWIGSLKPLWVPAWFGGAFSIFLLRQFFLTIPRELDEAAMIDGCSHPGIFWRIILPLSRPALIAVALFQFIASWNDFVAPLIFLNHQEQYTLALGLYMFESQQTATPWNLVMAASVLVILPVLVLFLIAQRSFTEGIATSGLKS